MRNQPYATTSAALKLLRRRRTLLNSGRSDFEPGTTTAEGSLFIHASGAGGACDLRFGSTGAGARARLLMSVGSRDGALAVGDPGVSRRCGAEVTMPFAAASRGILCGGGPVPPVLVPAPVAAAVVPAAFRAFVVERVVRSVRSDAGIRAAPLVLGLFRTGAVPPTTPYPPSSSSSSSSSGSMATRSRFATGVLRGCPGVTMAFTAWADFVAHRCGVTGGTVDDNSMGSRGGVTGATTASATDVVADAAACVLWISSTAAHLDHSSCFRYMYCCICVSEKALRALEHLTCCGPTTQPGLTIRMNAMASFAVNPYFHIRYAASKDMSTEAA